MTALRDHARLVVFVDGTYLIEVTSIDFTTESGQVRIDTFEGLVGFSPGSGKCAVKLGLAVPIGGQEFPFQQKCYAGEIVSMQIGVGKDAYTGNGKIMDTGISQSVNAAAEQSVSWEGTFGPLQ